MISSIDGSPVALYRWLSAEPDLSLIRPCLRARSKVLDLGCGAGRLANPLSREGYEVVGVDLSDEMLKHVSATYALRAVRTVRLSSHFDAAIAASHLFNDLGPVGQREMLASAAFHLRRGGRLLLHHHRPNRATDLRLGYLGTRDEVHYYLDRFTACGTTIYGCSRYQRGGAVVEHHWCTTLATEAKIEAAVQAAGFEQPRYLDSARTWLAAVRK